MARLLGLAEWNALSTIGNSQLAKSTILIPILGYFVLFNDEIVNWLKLYSIYPSGGHSIDVLWRLMCLYFGSCFFAAGAICYAYFCPRVIKKYRDAFDYIAGEGFIFFAHPSGGRKDDPKRPKEGKAELQAFAKERQRDLFIQKQPLASHVLEQRQLEFYVQAQETYIELNSGAVAARRTTQILYVVGSGLILAPTIWTFVQILSQLVRKAIA